MPIHMHTNFRENRLNYAAKVFAKLQVTAWAWHDSIGLKEIVKRMKMDERHLNNPQCPVQNIGYTNSTKKGCLALI